MKSFEKLCERLVKMEGLRATPLDIESFNSCLQESKSAEEAYEKYTQSSVFEEFSYDTNYPELYPIPRTYANHSGEGPRGFEDKIAPAIRKAVLSLKKQKRSDQSVVYSMDKKEALLISRDELDAYVKRGYSVVYEEANVTFGNAPAADTDGSFDKVAGYDLPLFKKNKKELKKYKGKVFEVPSHIFRRLKEGHPRYNRWADYIHEEDDANFINLIKDYSMRNPRSPVVIRNEEDGDMAIMRRRTNDARLKHNRSK